MRDEVFYNFLISSIFLHYLHQLVKSPKLIHTHHVLFGPPYFKCRVLKHLA